jgi:periplasmic mercuric ion binding protein
MMLWQNTLLTLVATGLLVSAQKTTEVSVKGVHLCCESCSDGADSALEGIKGVSQAANDRKAKTITFQAESKEAALEGLKSLAKEGFYGTATYGKEELKWPESGAKKGAKVPTVVIESVHLCCGACVTGVKEALAKLEGSPDIEVDRKAQRITVKGKDLDEVAVISALNKAGFFGTVKHEGEKK